ncbi:hypothetical protein B484DRAFT_355354 [Ochromonadaceae sp. CCMP2298]|nr:hypothetical protein B484DRAFT_355354 [Ochromonadaceae sp. CCMP2298]|mmetsp:Transcript_5234/g.11575  ORF Transcript_5234/g.11575 Transcript_5234/m.11575 type:complete len:108 (-) Transcript_5234:138-461(-)
MCKHIFNVKVVIRSTCCNRWVECSECHDEQYDHLFEFNKRLKMFCKPCSRTFERDLRLLTIKDKYCYACGTCWCIPGVTPESTLYSESLAVMDKSLGELLERAGVDL